MAILDIKKKKKKKKIHCHHNFVLGLLICDNLFIMHITYAIMIDITSLHIYSHACYRQCASYITQYHVEYDYYEL